MAGWVAGGSKGGGKRLRFLVLQLRENGALRGFPARRGYVENGLPVETRGKAFPP